MTDRELLELAALAAGIELLPEGHPAEQCLYGGGPFLKDGWETWNPLEDDGDALRLAVKLKLKIDLETDGVVICSNFDDVVFLREDTGTDPCAATRRAIVRAAAAVGKKFL